MAGVFIMGLSQLSGSSASLIAREKAREAVESVHTARDTGRLRGARFATSARRDRLRRTAPRARSSPALQPLKTPATDGLVNTGDDGARSKWSLGPGAGQHPRHCRRHADAADDYTRQIEITDIFCRTAGRTRTCGS